MASRKRSFFHDPIVLIVMVGLFVAVIAINVAHRIPASAITPTAMGETSVRIGLYFERNKHLPPDLGVLPRREGYWNRTTDRWNRPLRYSIDAEDAFTLSSLGKDDKAGGDGDDADMVKKYRVDDWVVSEVPSPFERTRPARE